MLTESLDVFVSDFGIPATWTGVGSETALVIFDLPDSDILSRRVQSVGYKITFRATHFRGIKHGDAVVIAGQNYTVQTMNQTDDAAFFEAELEHV